MKTVLLVDDDALFVRSLSTGLEAKGLTVLTAGDGAAAIEIVRSKAPDCAVLDLFMPGMEGMETLQQMQRIAPDMPVYVVTGGGQKRLFELLDVAEGFGAAGTLRKPFTAADLLGLIAGGR